MMLVQKVPARELEEPAKRLTHGLACARDSACALCAAASFSASCKAGRASEIWLRRASLAFSNAGSCKGNARAAALIIGSTSCSVSIRYESCLVTEKALPMEEWLWNLSAAFTSGPTFRLIELLFTSFPSEDGARRDIAPCNASATTRRATEYIETVICKTAISGALILPFLCARISTYQ